MRIVSAIQPSGKLHLGNYFGALQKYIKLQEEGQTLFFIANLHALTTVRNGEQLQKMTYDLALDYLAFGLDPKKTVLFRQSDVLEHTELAWYLATVAPMGLLERAHSYKDKVTRGLPPSVGLFEYPILMAADILLYRADRVPVGKDQMQHLEITRDLASKFNAAYVLGYDSSDPEGIKEGNPPGILTLPSPVFMKNESLLPGTNGEKMSKSYNNVIEIFADEATITKKIMSIKTDSSSVIEPKDMSVSPIFALLQLFATPSEMADIEESCRTGGRGYVAYKHHLLECFHKTFRTVRQRRRELEGEKGYVENVLNQGAERARQYASSTMEDIRQAVGTARKWKV